ncbi:hypothetical protein [uncultured Mailhella sp.]|uniref:hypothetical protein n=1 Tax=uncultured Mailhella sp. TaxID=1981031 RepID=UPI002631AEC4|nr:hypothetical protein [uncultured Mailhella sp.]
MESNYKKDYIDYSVEALVQFRHAYCVDHDAKNYFHRCKECPFSDEEKNCRVKMFLNQYTDYIQVETPPKTWCMHEKNLDMYSKARKLKIQ